MFNEAEQELSLAVERWHSAQTRSQCCHQVAPRAAAGLARVQLGPPRTHFPATQHPRKGRSSRKRWQGCRILLLSSIRVLWVPTAEQQCQHTQCQVLLPKLPQALLVTWNPTRYHRPQPGAQRTAREGLNQTSLTSRTRQTRKSYWFLRCVLDHSLRPYIPSHSKHLQVHFPLRSDRVSCHFLK